MCRKSPNKSYNCCSLQTKAGGGGVGGGGDGSGNAAIQQRGVKPCIEERRQKR